MVGTVYVTDGEIKVVDLIDGTSAVHLDGTNSHVEWGTGTTDPVKGDGDIETPGGEARVLCTIAQPSADINEWTGTITAAGAKTISEVGLFDDLTAGLLIIRSTFAGIPVVASDQIEFTVTLEQT